jgi:hypothetical protein
MQSFIDILHSFGFTSTAKNYLFMFGLNNEYKSISAASSIFASSTLTKTPQRFCM